MRRIDPTELRASTLKPDGFEINNGRLDLGQTPVAFSEWKQLGVNLPHLPNMRPYRPQRICDQLIARDLSGILQLDPLKILYATDPTDMQSWYTQNPAQACFVAVSGYLVLWTSMATSISLYI